MLKSLELSGFKSFAHKTVMDFDAPLSAIVGPNGSGKSNAAEAFRFVLGEQSMKSMRTKKSEDLLFSGSHKTPRANRAHVKVLLDNSEELLDIEYDTVSIERIVHRDSTNEYLINGSRVRLKDIVELMASANIGPSGHHMISQGESDRILLVRPEERKLMIEDALGLKIYHVKRKEAMRKLRKTAANLKEIKALRKELAPHYQFAKKQVKKIERAKELRRELAEKGKTYFAHLKKNLDERERKLFSGNALSQERISDIKKEIEELESSISSESNNQEAQSHIRELESKEKGLRGSLQHIEHELGKVEGALEVGGSAASGYVEISRSDIRSLISRAQTALSAPLEKARETLQHIINALSTHSQHSDHSETPDKTSKLTEKKKALLEKKTSLQKEYEETVTAVREEREKERQAEREKNEEEKRYVGLKGTLSRLQSEQEIFSEKSEELERDKRRFKEEMGEIAVYIGREALDYEETAVEAPLSPEALERKRKETERVKLKLEDSRVGSEKEIRNEYNDIHERIEFFDSEIKDLEGSKEALFALVEELEEKLRVKFDEGIEKINAEFQRLFEIMFGGGNASLVISRGEEEEDGEVKEGIEIDVHLPHKRIKGLHMLSGGERALVSIALLFAMSQINPPPFIILDETDAALDEANSKKYGDMIKDLSKKSQLVLVTHNRETMSRANMLYGVTMGSDGVSRLLSIKFDEAVKVAK